MVYIYCQANRATGGTELLHQLGNKLILLGVETAMVYYGTTEGVHPVCEQFQKYKVPFTGSAEDTGENLVVIPEIAIGLILTVKKAKRVLWWLSVDNAPLDQASMQVLGQDRTLIHLVQSYYAEDFVQNKIGVEKERCQYLSDYINSVFLVPQASEGERKNVVLYNPVKGYKVTEKLIAASDPRISWKALSGFTPDEMRRVMLGSKVYIDFGNHPGKDRIPREAALCGCCIITNRRGAAAYRRDVEIDDNLKFVDDDTESIILAINTLIENYETQTIRYEAYRAKTREEFKTFETDLYTILCNLGIISPRKAPSQDLLNEIMQSFATGNYNRAYSTLIEYRHNNYEETELYLLLETAVRMAIGELPEAHYCAITATKKYPNNPDLRTSLTQCREALGL